MNERPEVKLDQLDTESQNPDSSRAERLRELFPEAVTEGTGDIDFDKLRELLGEHINTGKERYAFTWPGKHEAIRQSQTPSTATLRPLKEKSVDWDTTENLYIEGDNLEVLKLLQRSYHGQVDMIYIDPPYNTGNDFVYKDSFGDTIENYREQTGQEHASNPETNGRFHSNWLNMMYPRLRLARELLTPKGVIFISIDEHESINLRNICDEIYGENNFIAQIVIVNNPRGRQSDTFFATTHEYLLVYAKNKSICELRGRELTDEEKAEYSHEDRLGRYRLLGLRQRGVASLRADRPDMYFPIYVSPDGSSVSLAPESGWTEVLPKKSDGRDGRWMWGKMKCETDIDRLVPHFVSARNEYDIFVKDYLIKNGEKRTKKAKTVWDDKFLNNQRGTQEVKSLLHGDIASFPKSREYIEAICNMACNENSIILDFFSGSGTTGHAVMHMNAMHKYGCRFILIQIPEIIYNKKYNEEEFYTLCDIGEKRLQAAGKEIVGQPTAVEGQLDLEGVTEYTPDVGFRVFALDSSNLKSDEYVPGQELDIDLVKRDRTNEDLLFEVMLRWGLDLSLPVETKECNGYEYLSVAEGELVCCMNDGLTVDVIERIVSTDDKPRRVFIPDHVFGGQNNLKLNIVDALRRASSEGQEIELRTV